eukprot:122920-Rhodomonas_salina.4
MMCARAAGPRACASGSEQCWPARARDGWSSTLGRDRRSVSCKATCELLPMMSMFMDSKSFQERLTRAFQERLTRAWTANHFKKGSQTRLAFNESLLQGFQWIRIDCAFFFGRLAGERRAIAIAEIHSRGLQSPGFAIAYGRSMRASTNCILVQPSELPEISGTNFIPSTNLKLYTIAGVPQYLCLTLPGFAWPQIGFVGHRFAGDVECQVSSWWSLVGPGEIPVQWVTTGRLGWCLGCRRSAYGRYAMVAPISSESKLLAPDHLASRFEQQQEQSRESGEAGRDAEKEEGVGLPWKEEDGAGWRRKM